MRDERKIIGKRIERAEKALKDAIEAGDDWAAIQNRKAVRMARAEYGRVFQ